MIKLLAVTAFVSLAAACAAPSPGVAVGAPGAANVSSESGAAKAAGLGFHGPVYRAVTTDGPN